MDAKKYTLDDVRRMDGEIITPAVVAPIIDSDPHAIRLMARTHPEMLGFPVICVGRLVKIPRLAFIKFMEGRT